jgi:hemerythrin-like domain-containing protein
MSSISLRTIREEHASLTAVLHSLRLMLERGPGEAPEEFFHVVRAMLFYIDEFPERLHHPKETHWLFPRVAELAPECAETIARLEREHSGGEAAVRELQHLLLGWELLGHSRREPFAVALRGYIQFYMEHIRLEETVVLPAAQRLFQPNDWAAMDAAFVGNIDPLDDDQPRDPMYDRLFSRIVMRAPSPIGLG